MVKTKPEPEPDETIDPRLAEIAGSIDPAPEPIELDDVPEPAPEPEPEPEPPPLAGAKLIQGRWAVLRDGRAWWLRPASVDNKPAPSSLYDRREGDCILDPIGAACDNPGRLEAAIVGSGVRFNPVSLYDDEPIEAEIVKLREMGLNATADMLRERHPKADNAPYGPLALGSVMASVNLHRLGAGPVRDDLRAFLRRHANGDGGERGDSSEVKPTDDHRTFPGAFGSAVQNAVAMERGFGLVWSTYGPAEIVDDPQWRDERRLHVATILGGRPRTHVWTSFDDISV